LSWSACSCKRRPMRIMVIIIIMGGARGGSVGWGNALKARKSRVRFRWCHLSGRTVVLGSSQPLTEMSTRNIFWTGGKGGHKAYNLTTFMCGVSLQSGSLKLLGTLGHVTDLYWLLYL
jgi:hypothetical protein